MGLFYLIYLYNESIIVLSNLPLALSLSTVLQIDNVLCMVRPKPLLRILQSLNF